jgi:hypothetical protein
MPTNRNSLPSLRRIMLAALGAGLLVSSGVFPRTAEAQCRDTADPMVQDCTLGSYSPTLLANSTRSVFGKILSLAVSADGKRLYAGAYSGVWRSDADDQAGEEAGEKWRQLTLPQPPTNTNEVLGALRVPNIFDLVVSPSNKDIVLAAAATAVPGYRDSLVPDHSKNGIYRSEDGGESWQLVHQFHCPGSAKSNYPGAEPVGQIAFAPSNSNFVYAAGGCKIAISPDAGKTWVDHAVTDGSETGTVWHISVAPRAVEEGFISRVYAAGPDQIWFSSNAGNTWIKDNGKPPSENNVTAGTERTPFQRLGDFPSEGFQSSSARILVVEPGHPERVFLAIPHIMDGPAYFFPRNPPTDLTPIPDGTPCDPRMPPGTGPGCGGGTLWLGDYSTFSAGNPSARWEQVPGPPGYYGGNSTPSGRLYVAVHPLARTVRTQPYLLFFGDTSHVHVSLGVPRANNSYNLSSDWHRLDGRDASQSKLDDSVLRCRDDSSCNKLFVHADPHALVASNDFS